MKFGSTYAFEMRALVTNGYGRDDDPRRPTKDWHVHRAIYEITRFDAADCAWHYDKIALILLRCKT